MAWNDWIRQTSALTMDSSLDLDKVAQRQEVGLRVLLPDHLVERRGEVEGALRPLRRRVAGPAATDR